MSQETEDPLPGLLLSFVSCVATGKPFHPCERGFKVGKLSVIISTACSTGVGLKPKADGDLKIFHVYISRLACWTRIRSTDPSVYTPQSAFSSAILQHPLHSIRKGLLEKHHLMPFPFPTVYYKTLQTS